LIRPCILVVFLIALHQSAVAQDQPQSDYSTAPTYGGTRGTSIPQPLPTFGASGGTGILRHRDATGRPCLAVGGFARPHIIESNLYDHVITVTNICAKRISLQVCYYESQDCVSMDVPGDGTKEAILGTLPSTKDFRFAFREKF
jgi:hypothetical protein